jgi:hypothetical protein
LRFDNLHVQDLKKKLGGMLFHFADDVEWLAHVALNTQKLLAVGQSVSPRHAFKKLGYRYQIESNYKSYC